MQGFHLNSLEGGRGPPNGGGQPKRGTHWGGSGNAGDGVFLPSLGSVQSTQYPDWKGQMECLCKLSTFLDWISDPQQP